MKSPFPGESQNAQPPPLRQTKKEACGRQKKSRKTGEFFLENRTNNTIYSVYKKILYNISFSSGLFFSR
jgi:hypothetical protein